MRKVFLLLALSAVLISMQACHKKDDAGQSGKLKIAVIPKGTTHIYWKSVKKGAEKAASEFDAEIIWKGPVKESDRSEQIDIVNNFQADRVSAIVLAPLDDQALVRPVRDATAAKIPVVIIDSSLKAQVGKDFVSFVATDNHKGGEMAGEQLITLLGGKGKIVMLRYAVGSASTNEREEGFLAVMNKHHEIEQLSTNQYGGSTAIEAQDKATNLLDQLKKADGIFCPNESSTLGMLKTLQQAGLAGKVKFVGFDTSPALVEALKAGEIQGLVAQDPVKMGYEGVKAAIAAVKGKPVETRIDTGVAVITKENIEDPAIKKLIEP